MSTQIDTNGLFSEAAYGPDGPQGLSGVTGNGVAHEAAWKQALVQAKTLLFSETELPAQAGSAPPVVDAPNGALVSAPETDAKAGHPLSWDRLSMTVASMVAWNMSVEMADDVAAPPLTDDPLAMKSEALAAGVSVEPGPLVEAIDGPAPVRSTVLSSSLVGDESTAAVEPLVLTSDGARAEVGAMVDTGVDPNTVPDLGTRTPHEQTFREGTGDLNAQVAVRDGSTGLMDVEPQGLMSIQQGTASSDASRPIMMGVTNAGVSEIPSSSQ
ncbi:MAG: hypothetical protein VX127_17825, partial [Myxococcota bacterium]|nr:hypothetical protein [Myxococcota bacterium]